MCPRTRLSIMEIHPGPRCNLNCLFCYRRGRHYQVQRPLISAQRIQSLMAEFAAQGGRQVNLSGGVEPFTRPDLCLAALRSARTWGLETYVYTNGACEALQEEPMCLLLALLATQVRFSIPALREQTYRAVVRPGRDAVPLPQVKSLVHRLVHATERTPTQVGVSFVVIEENAAELWDAAQYWREVGVDFLDVRFDVTAAAGSHEQENEVVRHLQDAAQEGRFEPLRVNIGEQTEGRSFASKCWAPREKIVVDPFGLVWSCCLLAHPGLRPSGGCLGDITTSSLEEIVQRINDEFPRPHCRRCTPWEAKYNLQKEHKTWCELAATA
jgi:MoaA/NifB/PqqE/SkfB family radical SAM enzyme